LRRHEESEDKLTEELSPGAWSEATPEKPKQKSFASIDESVLNALRRAELETDTA